MLEAEDDGFGEYREKIPGIEVFDPWMNTFKTKHTHLTYSEIMEYKTPFLTQAMNVYNRFKACNCLFNGQVQNDERPTLLEVIRIFSEWENKMPSWVRENKKFL